MSEAMENHNEPPLAAPLHHDEDDAQSEVGDGSSSLSDIEQEADQDDQDDLDDLDSEEPSDDEEENDSEAETERLHLSPSKDRAHKDVVMTESHTFERQPSNLHNQYGADEDDDDEEDEDENEEQENVIHNDDMSDDELSLPDSPKSGADDAVADDQEMEDIDDTESPVKVVNAAPSAPKDIMHAFDLTNKKRKRSQIIDRRSLTQTDETDEPSRKRTGSVLEAGDDYAVDDDNGSEHDGMDTPNPVSGELSDLESIDGNDDDDDAEPTIGDKSRLDVEVEEHMEIMQDIALDRRARQSVSKARPTLLDDAEPAGKDDIEGEQLDDTAEVEADDDAEAALKDEAEQEKKRIALEQLGDIEKHFSSFRDRLHEERLAKLNHEEWMLKQDPPIHPEYLAMMQCIDERRDDRLRLEERRVAYQVQTINKVAVARRAQILSQFYQEVRFNREEKLTQLGKQWYEIQHDRRAYGSNVEDYALKFQTKRQDQLKNQVAYNTEVSILSGIAKYRGFPAAPSMAPATSSEREEDFKAMGKTQQQKQPQRTRPSLPLQDIAALRAASNAVLNPAEEQFIEQTPWANPKHPSHAHLLHRQSSAHQAAARTASPFSAMSMPQPTKAPNAHAPGLPISGTFSGANSASHPIHHGFVPGITTRRPMNEFNL